MAGTPLHTCGRVQKNDDLPISLLCCGQLSRVAGVLVRRLPSLHAPWTAPPMQISAGNVEQLLAQRIQAMGIL
jgi:hypothetical protein